MPPIPPLFILPIEPNGKITWYVLLRPIPSVKVINPQVFGGGEESTYYHLGPQQSSADFSPKISEKHANCLLAIKALNLLPAFIF